MRDRNSVVSLARSWIGKNEKDGSHKEIIDIYNSKAPFPRNTKMQYYWAWCATMWSAIAKKLGYEDIMPIEISVGELVENAKKMNCWIEKDSFVPREGDAVIYDWDDTGRGDCIGWPDHIGIIEQVYPEDGYFVTIEGNYDDQVKRRTVSINGEYIRGFITPKYDEIPISADGIDQEKDLQTIAREVITGRWGNNPERTRRLEEAGYSAKLVQDEVNRILNGAAVISPNPEQDQAQPVEKQVSASCKAYRFDKGLYGEYKTTADLYCRNDAGKNKKALCLIPKGTVVRCYGYFNEATSVRWPYIEFVIDGTKYIGFSSINYLKKV